MARLADALPLEQVARRWIVSADPEDVVRQLQPYLDAGFTHVVFHAPGADQPSFLSAFAEHIAPRLPR